MVEIHGELHTTCRILRAQEISPPRFLSVAVIFSGLSLCVCVSEAVASWGNTGGGGYVLGKPLNLSLWPSQATLQPCLGPFPNSQQRVRSCKTYVYIWATATSACAFSSYAVVAEGFHLDRSSRTRARLTADHAENNPTNHMPSFRYQEDRPPEPARIFLQHPFARRQPRQQLAICSGSSQRRNN